MQGIASITFSEKINVSYTWYMTNYPKMAAAAAAARAWPRVAAGSGGRLPLRLAASGGCCAESESRPGPGPSPLADSSGVRGTSGNHHW